MNHDTIELVHIGVTVFLAVVGLMNFWVQAKIDKRFNEIKTWVFKHFLTKREAELLTGKQVRPHHVGDFSALDGG